MRIFWALLRKELGTYFMSVAGYVIIAGVALLIGQSFVVLIHGLASQPSSMPVTECFYVTYYLWLIVLLGTPVITMRSFALEKSLGTFETLMTTQVRDGQVVAAKFFAALFFYMVTWLPLLVSLFVVQYYTRQGGLDPGTVGSMFLGIMLLGCLFLSMGCFASSLTRSQMTAAMVSLALGMSLFSLAYLAMQQPSATEWQTQVLSYFNLFEQMHDFARGVVDTRTVIFYLTTTLLFLFLTLRVVESRRWK